MHEHEPHGNGPPPSASTTTPSVSTMPLPPEIPQRTKFCVHCGGVINHDAVLCIHCGRQVEALKSEAPATPQININNNVSSPYIPMAAMRQKNKWIALALCFFIGYLGAHRFYEGKIATGILWLFTGGFFGIGILVDFIIILLKPNPYFVR